jgi:hypothetical protein
LWNSFSKWRRIQRWSLATERSRRRARLVDLCRKGRLSWLPFRELGKPWKSCPSGNRNINFHSNLVGLASLPVRVE